MTFSRSSHKKREQDKTDCSDHEDKVRQKERIEAEASEADILALIDQTDRVAEITNSLRLGTPVMLTEVQAISVEK